MSKQNKMESKAGITKEEWIAICKKADKWCAFIELTHMTQAQAEGYIRTMPVFESM